MNNEEIYINPKQITKQFSITSATLRRWSEEGKIKCLRPNPEGKKGGKRIYNLNDIKKIIGFKEDIKKPKERICYARVSSNHQREDLQRQIELLKEKYPNTRIIKDIGSGLNWKRPGLLTLLESVYSGDVSEIVVTYKDRLCRFGYELMEFIFKKSNVNVVVLCGSTNTQDSSKELSDDLLAITTVFVAKNNGLRAANYRRERKTKEYHETIQETSETDNL